MPELRQSYAPLLREQVDEPRIAGNLRAVRRRQSERRVRRARIVASTLTALVCALCGVLYVHLETGKQVALQITSRTAARCLTSTSVVCDDALVPFDDGSQVAIDRDTRLELVQNDGHRVRSVLHRGWARFSVRPGGPRRWSVELGGLEVEVVGTAFSVLRRGELARVVVHHGRVLVRGARVPGGSVLLTSGQAFAADRSRVAVSSEPARPAVAPLAASDAAAVASPAELPAPHFDPAPRRQRATPRAPGDTTGSVTRSDAEEALVAADRLRQAGDAGEAHEVLARALRADQRSPHAGLVAFTLAQLSLDALAAPERAAAEFAQALESGSLSRSLREQAMARRVEALARAGQLTEARVAGQTYLEAYPEGRWTAAMARWAATE